MYNVTSEGFFCLQASQDNEEKQQALDSLRSELAVSSVHTCTCTYLVHVHDTHVHVHVPTLLHVHVHVQIHVHTCILRMIALILSCM